MGHRHRKDSGAFRFIQSVPKHTRTELFELKIQNSEVPLLYQMIENFQIGSLFRICANDHPQISQITQNSLRKHKPTRHKSLTDKKAFACFAPLRETDRFVTAQPAKNVSRKSTKHAKEETDSKT
jgi:hypothetical protein